MTITMELAYFYLTENQFNIFYTQTLISVYVYT